MARRRQDAGAAPEHPQSRPIRCAIYCRKSTTENLDRDFNTLDAQRESGEAYIRSQRHEGWIVLPQEYSDGGFTGGNLERPALQRLLDDIDAGLVDVVVVYKIDRLSRSLVDFLGLMQRFDAHNVAFASVTQQIRTDTSMGRLMLNILAAFGEYERELIAERTKDKMGAARRKGKFVGGSIPLGYDLDLATSTLQVNPAEAAIVRELFYLYRTHQSTTPVGEEAARRGWRTKTWVTREGKTREGGPLNRDNLSYLLRNVTYIGKVKYEGEICEGEHDAIVDEALFNDVQEIMTAQKRTCGRYGGNGIPEAILKHLIRCAQCGNTMIHSVTYRKEARYRYYVCTKAQQNGVKACPASSVPAAAFEQCIMERIRTLATHPEMIAQVVGEAAGIREQRIPELRRDIERLEAQCLERRHADEHLSQLVASSPQGTANEVLRAQARSSEAQLALISRQLHDTRQELQALERSPVNPQTLQQALSLFDPVWDVLYPVERARILRLLIERIDYNGTTGQVGITFHPLGITTLLDEMAITASADQPALREETI